MLLKILIVAAPLVKAQKEIRNMIENLYDLRK